MADQILDVDAPVPECAALLVRFGDLRLERDDSFESGYEVGHQAAPRDVCDGRVRMGTTRMGRAGTLCWCATVYRGGPRFPAPGSTVVSEDSRSEAVTSISPR
ncbi:hypothetical protein SAV31267_054950 [Streptomyces avermitilis]|uniref:Uncharacterized protein n=1 Tax=Streptomyces avermitilis TaxID=33903 RepID=A0A4D4MV14_STRAX|nr:hypothetical protein SAV31267_054950 [Streptomyces avermitilis]